MMTEHKKKSQGLRVTVAVKQKGCKTLAVIVIFLVAGNLMPRLKESSAQILKRDPFRYQSYDPTNVMIERVLSADTVILENDEKIKLIGLRAPEPPPPEKIERDQHGFVIQDTIDPRTPLDQRALNFAQELLEKKHVRLEFDHEKRDENFYTVAYVFLPSGTLANTEILRQGYAHLRIRPPNVKYADQLREAYKEARREKRGLQGQ